LGKIRKIDEEWLLDYYLRTLEEQGRDDYAGYDAGPEKEEE